MKKYFLVLLIVGLIFGAVFAGCVSSAEQEQMKNGTTKDNEKTNETPESGEENTTMKKEEDFKPEAENKTGMEKTEEAVNLAIADGTYTESVTYNYHSGSETVEMTVVVKNDIIEGINIVPGPNAHNVTQKIVAGFTDALPDLVLGKKIDELDLPKNVGGSSLTTAAFKGYVERLV
ncbi:MAG TPA: hypothetical protein VI912_03085, partial [Candidatus Bilamarchaeaceae archaeon]|nr:hypothetical protein [Candidatus Bilamarchaeaceae archaeon]